MGSSKKHKEKDKEHKKKRKHKERSRSRSPRERKHKKDKKHKHESNDYSPEVKRPRQAFEEGEVSEDEQYTTDLLEQIPLKKETPQIKTERDFVPPPAAPANASGDTSLSIEETNRLRAKLGLKPLEGSGGSSGGEKNAETAKKENEDVHVPAVNISDVKRQEALREKLMAAKEKRRINKMLGKVKTIAEDDDEDALAWVRKSRKIQQEREMADKRARLLEEMDEEFGIGNLVDEEFGAKKQKEYASKDLRGLRVEHTQESFTEGRTVILTLKDKGVLDEEDDDILVNINMMDDERARENVENKKRKPDYKPYQEDEIDEYGMMKPREVLGKYNEEIEGKKKETFELGYGGKYDAQHERRMHEIKKAMQEQSQALTLPAPNIQREFYTEEEIASFKKVKKKVRKIRKKPKVVTADDLTPLDDDPMQTDFGNRNRKRNRRHEESEEGELIEDVKREAIPGLDLISEEVPEEPEILGPEEDLTGVAVEDEAGIELELALNKARKLKVKKQPAAPEKLADKIEVVKESDDEEEESEKQVLISGGRNISLNQTSEFCRSLGEIPTYGMAGNRLEEEEDELMDFERELAEERRLKEEEDENNPGWQQVQIDTRPVDITHTDEQNVLDDEPVLNEGIAAALHLAQKKGYVDKDAKKEAGHRSKKVQSDIEAQNYSIEDKRYDDLDEKYRKRDRFGGGMVTDFKEKHDYKPEVKIEYRDDQGRDMNEKEAFRYLSHRFHGKGSGKLKTEKRQKKFEQEQLMKSMTSTDTPLGSASKLGEKLSKEKTAYIVLSGANKNNPTSLTKT